MFYLVLRSIPPLPLGARQLRTRSRLALQQHDDFPSMHPERALPESWPV